MIWFECRGIKGCLIFVIQEEEGQGGDQDQEEKRWNKRTQQMLHGLQVKHLTLLCNYYWVDLSHKRWCEHILGLSWDWKEQYLGVVFSDIFCFHINNCLVVLEADKKNVLHIIAPVVLKAMLLNPSVCVHLFTACHGQDWCRVSQPAGPQQE